LPTESLAEPFLPVSVGQAARILGVSPSSVRLWEKHGLVSRTRTGAGKHRRYAREAVEALARSPEGRKNQGQRRG